MCHGNLPSEALYMVDLNTCGHTLMGFFWPFVDVNTGGSNVNTCTQTCHIWMDLLKIAAINLFTKQICSIQELRCRVTILCGTMIIETFFPTGYVQQNKK